MATWIIGGMVFLIMALIVIKLCNDKKNGKSGCGSSCHGCPNSEYCHSKK